MELTCQQFLCFSFFNWFVDIEAEIRALQLDSAEDNNDVVNPEDAKLEKVEKEDEVEVEVEVEGW